MNDFERDLKESLKNPEFAKAWEDLEIPFRIAKNMMRRRYELNLTQDQLAKRSKLKTEIIEDLEFANCDLDVKILQQVANGLGVDISYLFSDESSSNEIVATVL